MSSSNESYFIHIEESTEVSISQSICYECFYIKLHHQSTTSLTHYSGLIPRNILCDFDDFECLDPDSFTNIYLRNMFSLVPISIEVLEQTLLLMSDYARYMNPANFEELRILEMHVFINETSSGIDDQNASIATILNSLEKIKLDDIASSCSLEQCAICLEEFSKEPQPNIVRTKCMHIFHEDCVARWLQHCGITNRLYSCPMCRSQIQ